MKRIEFLIIAAAALLLIPAFGGRARAQRPTVGDDGSDLARPTRSDQGPVREPGQPVSIGLTTTRQGSQPGGGTPASVQITVPNRPFTLASSTGTVDEDSTSIVQLKNFTATFLTGATGSVHVRYNLSSVDDISRFCPATQSGVRVRFRNSDNSGTTARVSFEIHQTNVNSGGNNILYTFSSDGIGNGPGFTTAVVTVPNLDFDFGNNVYWIEATIFRSNPGAFADLGSVQIWEDAGTVCP
jgi:hypothetical protein